MKKNKHLKVDKHKDSKIVITYGTFDLFHRGHERLLKRASLLGDKLIVAVSTDKFNKLKGKKANESFYKRKKAIKKLPFVWKVIKEKDWNQKVDDVVKYSVDTFVIGDDWKGKFDFLEKHNVRVEYLERTRGISSTMLRKQIASASEQKK